MRKITIEDMIEALTELEKENPEIELWTVIDAEGNGYNLVQDLPEIRYIHKNEEFSHVDNLHCIEDIKEDAEGQGYWIETILEDYRKVVLI